MCFSSTRSHCWSCSCSCSHSCSSSIRNKKMHNHITKKCITKKCKKMHNHITTHNHRNILHMYDNFFDTAVLMKTNSIRGRNKPPPPLCILSQKCPVCVRVKIKKTKLVKLCHITAQSSIQIFHILTSYGCHFKTVWARRQKFLAKKHHTSGFCKIFLATYSDEEFRRNGTSFQPSIKFLSSEIGLILNRLSIKLRI